MDLPTPYTQSLQCELETGASLSRMPTVRQLIRHVVPLSRSAACQLAFERFLADPNLYAIPVVDEAARPCALLDRKHYLEFFSKPFSREIFGRRTVRALLNHAAYHGSAPVVVDAECSIEDAAQIIIAAGMQHMVSGFLITRQGEYCGVANGHDLLNIITQRRQAELFHLAHYDHLTGIPNRLLFGDRLTQACLDAKRNGKLAAVLFIDIDRFKQINDSLGHAVGDVLLRKVVARLKASARGNDTVARLGGDEFVVLMENLASPASVEALVERIRQSMQEPVDVQGQSLMVSISIGSALFPNDDADPGALLSKADSAMYEAKRQGRNNFRRYANGMKMYNPASMLIENGLRRAIAQNELELHFQPQVGLTSRGINGVEALVRWRSPEMGLVPPLQFIPIAEECGLIVALGSWVLRSACLQLRDWLRLGLPPLRMSVNISALQLQQGDFPELLASCLVEYGVDPQLIEIELTESTLMHNLDEVLRTLEAIKSLGVKLAIDDFGTGFSSLSYLHRFPIDRLKIDQSFVRGIEQTPINESITRAIIALANSLSLDVIAEGVETPAEMSVLAQLRCPEGQGYLFARPLPADDFVAYYRAWLATCDDDVDGNAPASCGPKTRKVLMSAQARNYAVGHASVPMS